MDICEIIKIPKYLRMSKCVSTLQIPLLNTLILMHMDKYGEMPEIDEIGFLNSSEELKQGIKVLTSSSGKYFADVQNILDYTGTNNIQDAIIQINTKMHLDLDVLIFPIGETAIVQINKRPSNNSSDKIDKTEIDITLDPYKKKTIISDMLYDLSLKLGVKFIQITNEELESDEWKNILFDSKATNAFVYNGDIYINIDNADIDAPLHELSHILIGNIRYINPELYQSLISIVGNLSNIELLLSKYQDRTMNDKLEEVFVTEFSKYLCNIPSAFDSLDKLSMHKVEYHMQRCIDTMLKGDYSVKNTFDKNIGGKSLTDLAKLLLSHRFNNSRCRYDYSYLHRIVNNVKSLLIKNGDIIEECD